MTRIERRIQEQRDVHQQTTQGPDQDGGGGTKVPGQGGASNDAATAAEKPEPNPLLAAGSKLPTKLGEFPPELYGKPIEDVDQFYQNQYVSIFDW